MARSAHLIAIGLSHAMNKNIKAWVQQFNFFPPLPVSAHKADYVTNDSLEDLLKRLIDSQYRSFILIIHGLPDGSGLYLNLVRSQSRPHTNHYDLQALMDAEQGAELDKPLLQKMGITHADAKRLIDLMRKVRAKKIECIEFRSCNLGRSDISLDRFRRFLGASLAGAPNLHTVFGLVPVIIGPNFQKVHERHHVGAGWETYNYPTSLETPRVVCCFQLNALQKPELDGHIGSDLESNLDAWINEWMMVGGKNHGRTETAMHALWIADQVVKEKGHPARMVPVAIEVIDKDSFRDPLGGLYGPTVQRFIPPLSMNFKKHIIYSPK